MSRRTIRTKLNLLINLLNLIQSLSFLILKPNSLIDTYQTEKTHSTNQLTQLILFTVTDSLLIGRLITNIRSTVTMSSKDTTLQSVLLRVQMKFALKCKRLLLTLNMEKLLMSSTLTLTLQFSWLKSPGGTPTTRWLMTAL